MTSRSRHCREAQCSIPSDSAGSSRKRAASALNHPNILTVFDIGTADDSPYVVTELLEGETLTGPINGAVLPPRKAIDYATQIARGLSAAHARGIVYRDLKPDNLFVTSDGRVKILDFGLAKLVDPPAGALGMTTMPTGMPQTLPGIVLGTIGYMSPEQVRGQPTDRRGDIFAFGAILYEMLSGRRAFSGDSAIDRRSSGRRAEACACGCAWNRGGTILMGSASGLHRIQATGGSLVPVTARGPNENGHGNPRFLADGSRFVFSRFGADPGSSALFLGSLDSSETRRITTEFGHVEVVSNFLVFSRDRSVFAQPFDVDRVEVTGDPTVIADEVQVDAVFRRAAYSVSENGVFVFYSGREPLTQLTWFARNGAAVGTVATPGVHATMSSSADQRRVVYGRRDSEGFAQNLWVTDLVRDVSTRLTFGANRDSDGTWSPDGSRIAYGSIRQGLKSLYEMPSAGGADRLLLKSEGAQLSMDAWSPDGRHILYHVDVTRELRAMQMDGDRKTFVVVQPPSGRVDEPAFSPDGKWLAYNSEESGRFEVYVVPFPPTGARWQLSANGGGQPRWRGDGRELVYLAPDGAMMAVDIKAGVSIEPGTPHALFKTNVQTSFLIDQYAVTADGQRFLIMNPSGDGRTTPMTVVLDWPALPRK